MLYPPRCVSYWKAFCGQISAKTVKLLGCCSIHQTHCGRWGMKEIALASSTSPFLVAQSLLTPGSTHPGGVDHVYTRSLGLVPSGFGQS